MPSSLTPIDVTPTSITAMSEPKPIPFHTYVSTIPTHVTYGTNNRFESNSSDGILEIIDIGSTPFATVDLSYLHDTIHNALSRSQGSLQEEFAVAGSLNTVSATSEPSFLDLDDRTINELMSQL